MKHLYSLADIEEMKIVVGSENADKLVEASESGDLTLQKDALKNCFASMMRQDKIVVQSELKKLVQKVKSLG